MKKIIVCLAFATTLFACTAKIENSSSTPLPLIGTWQLISGTLVEKGDTVVTDYTQKLSFIKIINATHFAFFNHDLAGGKDSSAVFGAGGGSYTLKDSTYTEHLEYCNDRNWEGHDFTFTVTIQNDTLIQRGVEVVEASGVNRLNIEKYRRVKQ